MFAESLITITRLMSGTRGRDCDSVDSRWYLVAREQYLGCSCGIRSRFSSAGPNQRVSSVKVFSVGGCLSIRCQRMGGGLRAFSFVLPPVYCREAFVGGLSSGD